MLLPDINVWLAMTFATHVHHATAKVWFDALATDGTCYFCRLTQQGFLRLASNAKVFRTEALTLQEAWRFYDALANDSRVNFAMEPSDLEPHWRGFTQAKLHSTNVWSDAYLAAFAMAADFTLVSLDADFARYRDVKTLVLK